LLLLDGSGSAQEVFRWQVNQHARAITDPAVLAAIQNGNRGRIAVAAAVWSKEDDFTQCVPWLPIQNTKQAARVAAQLRSCEDFNNGTAVFNAVKRGVSLFPDGVPDPDQRWVIDVAANQKDNSSVVPHWEMRQLVRQRGITVNAIVFGTGDKQPDKQLKEWYQKHVRIGRTAFVYATNAHSFTDYLVRKLIREIRGKQFVLR
jgi:hypothetical protein